MFSPIRAAAQKIAGERVKLEAEWQRLLRLTLKGTVTGSDFERESKRIEGELRSLDELTPAPVGYDFDPAKLVLRITRTFVRFQSRALPSSGTCCRRRCERSWSKTARSRPSR